MERLTDYKLTQAGIISLQASKLTFSDAQETILGMMPEGREKAIVRTKLQEASFYMTRGIASAEQNHSEIITH